MGLELYVKDILATNIISRDSKMTLKEAVDLFSSGIKQIPIVEEKKVKGILTAEGIYKALLESHSLGDTVENYLDDVIIVQERAVVNEILDYPIDRIIIVDANGDYLGIISYEKMLITLLEQRDVSRVNLNAFMSACNNCVVAINCDGLITNVNDKFENLLDVCVKEVIGRPIKKIIPNCDLQNVIRTGISEYEREFVLNEQIYIVNRIPINRDGIIIGAVAIFQDVTKLHRTTDELTNVKKYKDILETVVDNDYDCIVVVDAEGIITMFNTAYEKFLGITRDKAIGKHVTEVIENTRMHIVAKTGVAEMAELQKIRGREMICNRVPIKKDGKIWGALGKIMFKDVKEFTAVVEKFDRLQSELEYYKEIVKKIQSSNSTFENIMGSSSEITEVKTMAQRVAQSKSTVLIRGESGTGKELFANAIHYSSARKNGPFIKVNCSAIPENLLESELFGYEEGAFTGAKKGGKLGKFELADKGTLFLDEIGDMPFNMQVKLLRVLQEKEIEKVGGTSSISVDVRLVTATNRNLEDMIKQGRFRVDLYYRLNVVELKIPPLRERRGDIEELIYSLLNKLSQKMGCPEPDIDKEAMHSILNYNWPGNVRELENVMERCLNFVENGRIMNYNLPYHIRNNRQGNNNKLIRLKDHLEEAERLAIIDSLKKCGGNRVEAAKMLGISRANIYQKLVKYQIN